MKYQNTNQYFKSIHPKSDKLMQNYFTKRLFLLVISLLCTYSVYAQTKVSGKVTDGETQEGLVGVSVVIKGTSTGTATDEQGGFTLETTVKKPFTVIFSMVGFASKEIVIDKESNTQNLQVELGQITFLADEVVISASRRFEKITEAPQTVNIISSRNIEELPTFNLGELAARQKGVDYVRAGVLGTGLNIRGFNSAFNPKNLQINDYRLSTLIATGLPLGNLSTLVKEDIERVEIVLGPSSALYGPNAGNGLVNTITKDPRSSEGTTMALGFGNRKVFTGRFRHAQVLSNKFAFKVTGEFTRGEEFEYVDSVYLGSGEAAIPKTELELDRDFNTIRGEAAVYFSPTDNSDIILQYGGNNSNNLAQTNAGRNQIRDWQVHYLQLRYVSPHIFAQLYHTWSKTDSTYAINQRTQNYWSFRNNGFSDAEARQRSFKEQWFPVEGAPGGGIALNRGALFQDNSRRLNGELQYNNSWEGLNLIVGGQFQRDVADSRGTYLLDTEGEITINQVGFYAQLEKTFGKIKLVAAARADNHELYGFNFIPKGAILHIGDKGTWRLTYGQGITAPTILNLEANIFGGLLVGNGEGFTLNDGTEIEELKVEKVSTIELGYKGRITDKLFIDGNAYYNFSKDFLSPAINLATPAGVTVTHRGGRPIQEVLPGTPETGAAFLLTYLNFGNVDTYGLDLGINYLLTKNLSLNLNYSYFGFSLDKNDLSNDGNRDGVVVDTDLPINTPEHKLSLALNYSKSRLFGSIFMRWVDAYDFFSGINVAAATNEELGIQENARVGRTWNYGPLGDFINVDISAGYRFDQGLQISGQITNLFDSNIREFIASPAIGRMYSIELKMTVPPFKKN